VVSLRCPYWVQFVNDMDSGIECTLSKFADNTKLSGAIDMPEGQDAIQRDLDKLKKWAHMNIMRFNKAKCKVLHLDRGNPWYQHKLGDEGIESSPAENLGVLVDEKVDITPQCALTVQRANHILGCIKSSVACRSRDGSLSLFSGESPRGVLRPAVEPLAQERHEPVGAGTEEGDKNDPRAGAPLIWGRAERVGVAQPGEEKAARRPYSSLSVRKGDLRERLGQCF